MTTFTISPAATPAKETISVQIQSGGQTGFFYLTPEEAADLIRELSDSLIWFAESRVEQATAAPGEVRGLA